MVDVGDKPDTVREARAEAWVRMSEHTLSLIETGGHKKGDVIAVARIAGIQAATDLAVQGFPVTLVEKTGRLGGRPVAFTRVGRSEVRDELDADHPRVVGEPDQVVEVDAVLHDHLVRQVAAEGGDIPA